LSSLSKSFVQLLREANAFPIPTALFLKTVLLAQTDDAGGPDSTTRAYRFSLPLAALMGRALDQS
jgi:hypothetical protein